MWFYLSRFFVAACIGYTLMEVGSWMFQEESAPLEPERGTVSRILVDPGDGSETVLWQR